MGIVVIECDFGALKIRAEAVVPSEKRMEAGLLVESVAMRTERLIRHGGVVVIALRGGVEQVGSAVAGVRSVGVVDLFRSDEREETSLKSWNET